MNGSFSWPRSRPARSSPAQAAVHDLTRRVTGVLEAWIRRYPRQWRWIHWRWRERPEGGSESYRRRDLRQAFAEPAPGGAGSGEGAAHVAASTGIRWRPRRASGGGLDGRTRRWYNPQNFREVIPQ